MTRQNEVASHGLSLAACLARFLAAALHPPMGGWGKRLSDVEVQLALEGCCKAPTKHAGCSKGTGPQQNKGRGLRYG